MSLSSGCEHTISRIRGRRTAERDNIGRPLYGDFSKGSKIRKEFVFLPAIPAIPFYFQGMLYPFKQVRPAEFILDRLKLRRKHLDNFPASHAYQVIMVLMAEGMLIMGMFVAFLDLLDKAAFQKEREGPVNGSLRNLDTLAPHISEQFFGVEMAMEGEDLVKNSLSFLRELKALPVEKFFEYRPLHKHILMKKGMKIQIC